MVGGTTKAGKLLGTIVSRVPLVPPMTDYTEEEAAKIAQVLAKTVLAAEGLP